jgi:hypothetical protein
MRTLTSTLADQGQTTIPAAMDARGLSGNLGLNREVGELSIES